MTCTKNLRIAFELCVLISAKISPGKSLKSTPKRSVKSTWKVLAHAVASFKAPEKDWFIITINSEFIYFLKYIFALSYIVSYSSNGDLFLTLINRIYCHRNSLLKVSFRLGNYFSLTLVESTVIVKTYNVHVIYNT